MQVQAPRQSYSPPHHSPCRWVGAVEGAQAAARTAADMAPPHADPFYVGFAISVYQNSGDGDEQHMSNWGRWERSRSAFGMHPIAHGDRCREVGHPRQREGKAGGGGCGAGGGRRRHARRRAAARRLKYWRAPPSPRPHTRTQSCDFWRLYEQDIERAASLGSNCFRLSLEWARLEPERGRVDAEAVEHFAKILDCIQRWVVSGGSGRQLWRTAAAAAAVAGWVSGATWSPSTRAAPARRAARAWSLL